MLAFWTLSTCRSRGSDFIGPIPFTAMRDYATHYQLDADVAEAMFFLVRALDTEYLRLEAERIKRELAK